MSPTGETPVVIAGAGPVGLVMSILLSRSGIEHLLLESRSQTATHPKARGISARSMEILRRIGAEDRLRAAGLPAEHVAIYHGTSLVDPDFVRNTAATTGDDDHRPAVTPAPGVICSQDVLEAVLAGDARRYGAGDIRFGHTVIAFDQHQGTVRTAVKDHAGERNWEIESQYLVGCDGAGSTIRRHAAIPMCGRIGLGHFTSVRFRAPLADVVADRVSASYFLTPPARGGFMAIDNDSHWIYQYPFDPATENPAGFDEHRWAALIRVAAGIADLDVTVLDTLDWRMDARLAATYRAGAVLLAGDAAHVTPPTGGHGMNLGIGDADNLAWKLGAVVAGHAGDALLDTYQAERRPIAAQVIDIATGNARSRGGYRIDDDLLLSATYVSAAVAGGPAATASRVEPDRYTPGAQPGRRLPHLQLGGAGEPSSTLDLIDTGFTLWHGPAAAELWRHQARHAIQSGLPVSSCASLNASRWRSFGELCGLPATSALLVRPDGHIAWRADTPPPGGTLSSVLAALLAR